MGRGEAAVPVEVGVQRGTDLPGRAGERGSFSSGEFDGGVGLPPSRHIASRMQLGRRLVGRNLISTPGLERRIGTATVHSRI